MVQQLDSFLSSLSSSLSCRAFVKLTLANYKGTEDGLKNVYARLALVKKVEQLSFTYRYKTKDIVKNHPFDSGIALIADLLTNGFQSANLFTSDGDFQLEADWHTKGWKLKEMPASHSKPSDIIHDRQKKRAIASSKPYLQALNLTDAEGNVYKSAQDKYRQINHYIEVLSPMLNDMKGESGLRVADMGSGKGYLTFALYDYLTNVLGIEAEVTGVEFREDLVALCNDIAQKSGFDRLRFACGSIGDFDSSGMDILIALHACDTATDDAIAKGIQGDAKLIVVAPCCHKQIRREMEKAHTIEELQPLLKHGIFMERQAEMVTDSIRGLILEYFGYSTKIFEFISDAHTPKNILIVAEKGKKKSTPKSEILAKINQTKAHFGIGSHYLEKCIRLGL